MGDCFIPDYGLVVGFCIADTLFFPTTIGHGVAYVADVPELIWVFFKEFDPEVW